MNEPEILERIEGKNTTYEVCRTNDGRRFYIRCRGDLPARLKGEWTRARYAAQAIHNYFEDAKVNEWKEKVKDSNNEMDPKLREQLEKRKAEKAEKVEKQVLSLNKKAEETKQTEAS